jgi:hypothetical protein
LADPGAASLQVGQAHFRYTFKPTSAEDIAHMAATEGIMRPESIGQVFVRCFVAYDIFPTEGRSQAEKDASKSCPSMPLCIKIRITGSKPEFVAPTPLGESFDDNGILVPNRHDFPACQGSPMRLQLTARDSMPPEVRSKLLLTPEGNTYLRSLEFRIFVEDKDVGYADANAKESYRYFNPGGKGNLDFFETAGQVTDVEVENKCGAFSGYGAQRMGNNAAQASPVPMAGEGAAKSVMSPYQTNPPVENCRCTLDPCSKCPAASQSDVPQASLTVTFDADPERQNGVALRSECREIDLDNGLEYERANCREKLTNMDQVICAVAYDNARHVLKRWVGERDPNGDDVRSWRRDHSNGDQASDMHCFRILIAAPPVFVTDPAGQITPFSDDEDANGVKVWRSIVDTTGVRAAYREINFRVGQVC